MSEFRILAALRGGWVVSGTPPEQGFRSEMMAAFSNKKDLMAWLDENLSDDEPSGMVYRETAERSSERPSKVDGRRKK